MPDRVTHSLLRNSLPLLSGFTLGSLPRYGFVGFVSLVLATLLVLSSAVSAQAQATANDLAQAKSLEVTIADVIAKAERSVVAITRSRRTQVVRPRMINGRIVNQPNPLANLQQPFAQPPHAHGAGVMVNDSGLVLTQYLVVKPGDQHHVIDVDGNRFPAEIKAADPRSGLAVLALVDPGKDPFGRAKATPPKAISVGRAENLRKGQFVVAIGNPFAIVTDGQPTASWGVVSNLAQKAPASETLNNSGERTSLHNFGTLIQTDAKLGWNASGGALVTLDGRLVGITTTTSSIAGHERPAGYAIPLNGFIRRVVGDLLSGKEPEYGLLGLSFDHRPMMSRLTGEFGIRINLGYPGGPATAGGLQSGDLITSINGQPTTDPDIMQLIVNSLPPGTKAQIDYERRNRPSKTTVKLGKAYVEDTYATKKPPSWRGIRVDYATATPSEILLQRSQSGYIDPEGCVVVSEVEPGSASARSGVQPYTYISHVGGKRVSSPQEFYDAVRKAKETVKVRFTKGPEAKDKS